MNSYMIDTHKAVQTLVGAGADKALAEAMVETFGTVPFENLATKADLENLQKVLTAEFNARLNARLKDMVTRDEFQAAIANLATKEELNDLRKVLTAEFDARLNARLKDMVTRDEFQAALATLATKEELKSSLKLLEKNMTIRLGLMMLGMLSGLGALQAFLGF